MDTKALSHKTFSDNSFDNWQSKKCDFCMYHDLIFDQLSRLKEAVSIKNQRISELEQFITRLSQMAFAKSPNSSSTKTHANFISPKVNESSLQLDNDLLLDNQKVKNPAYFKKRSEDSSEISFSDSNNNTAKFDTRMKQSWPDMNSRLQKISELNQMKKEMNRKILDASKKEQSKDSHIQSSSVNSMTTHEYDTLKSLSLPQEEGHINSIADSFCENSSVKDLSHRNTKINELSQGMDEHKFRKSHSSKVLQKDKSSIKIIKEYIKMLN